MPTPKFDYITSDKFGQLIRSERLKLGVTQARLAECAQVSETAVAMWERGERMPRIDSAQRIAVALGTTLSQLLWGF